MVTEIAKGVYWVGAVDWGIRHFHGFELSTHRGTTYNSYLIRDEKTVLVDTVWDPFQDEWLDSLRAVVDPAKIDIVVANHAEPDHSGSLPALMRLCPSAAVVVSKRGAESIPGHYHQQWNFRPVGTGDRISIGSQELVFVEAPMLHWPDSMFTYLAGRNLLMPNDAFGQHYASAFRFNDLVDQEELFQEALKYYVNILTPFSPLVARKIEEVLALKLPVEMIAPSHGVIWRKDPLQIVRKYQEWAAQRSEKRAVILYDTMWQATRRMAEATRLGGRRHALHAPPHGRHGPQRRPRRGLPVEGGHRRVADHQPGPAAGHHARPGGPERSEVQEQDRRGVRLIRMERRMRPADRGAPCGVQDPGGRPARPGKVAADRR